MHCCRRPLFSGQRSKSPSPSCVSYLAISTLLSAFHVLLPLSYKPQAKSCSLLSEANNPIQPREMADISMISSVTSSAVAYVFDDGVTPTHYNRRFDIQYSVQYSRVSYHYLSPPHIVLGDRAQLDSIVCGTYLGLVSVQLEPRS